MKILVVDDELVSRKKMNLIMNTLGECVDVDCGNDAIDAFEQALEDQSPFDFIALDIFMPEMDGKEVLKRIRQIESDRDLPSDERVKIFMVTSQSDKDTIIDCVQSGCDDFITKPFDKSTIIKKLVKSGLLEVAGEGYEAGAPQSLEGGRPSTQKEGILKDIIAQFKRGDIDLPSLPRIHEKYQELVGKEANLQAIAELLKNDAAISSKLISISNSPYYRGVVENKTLDQAIGRLGLDTTRQTVNAIANRSLYVTEIKKYVDIIEGLWEHSLSCAYASQLIADSLNLNIKEDAFTLGLFHDIGKLILVQVVGEIEKKSDTAEEVDVPELLETMNVFHGQTGSVLLKKWGFSRDFITVALYHNDIGGAKEATDALKLIYCSNLLVKTLGYGQEQPLEINLAEDETVQKLGLDESKLSEIQQQVKDQMSALKKYLE